MSDELRYVVRRLNWRRTGPGRFARLPGWTEVAWFPDPESADADRRAREADVRARVNPFGCAESVFELSSLPGPLLSDWLLDGGLELPPTATMEDRRRWWAEVAPDLSDSQRAHAWAGFDKLRFFETAERPAGGEAFVVGRVEWVFDEDRYEHQARYDGIEPVAAFRSAVAAERARRRVAEDARLVRTGDDDYAPGYTLVGDRAAVAVDPFAHPAFEPPEDRQEVPPEDAPSAEVYPVPVDDPAGLLPSARRVYVVHRLSWSYQARDGFPGWAGNSLGGGTTGVPVAAYFDRRAAEVAAWELDFVSRLYLNPFRFGHPRHLTTVAEVGFRSVLGDQGLNLPVDDWQWSFTTEAGGRWVRWWDESADGLSARQREEVWDLLDQLRFFTVVELDLGG